MVAVWDEEEEEGAVTVVVGTPDLTEVGAHLLPDHILMPGIHIPMTTTTELTHQGYLQMIDTPMTESADYHP